MSVALCHIVALATPSRAIGINNAMPWHLSDDLKHFKAQTIGKPLIMGRKTFQSIQTPLPGRTSFVISRKTPPNYDNSNVIWCSDLQSALKQATTKAENDSVSQVMIIGGGEIFKQTIEFVDCLFLTEIELDVTGDVFYPCLGKQWEESKLLARQTACNNQPAYTIRTFTRKASF